MSNIRDLIDSLHAQDTVASLQTFENIMNDKIAHVIQAKREQVGAGFFGESVDSFGKAVKMGMDERDAYDIGYEHGGLGKPHSNPHKPGSQDHTWYNDGYEQGKAENLDESVEELDELSKDTLKSYIKKAGPDAINRASSGAYKLANADTEDSFHNDDGSVDNGEKDDTKAVKRINGINTAVDKLTEASRSKYGIDNSKILSNGKKSTMIYDHSGHPKDKVNPDDHNVLISSGANKGTWLVRGKPSDVDNYTEAHNKLSKGYLDESLILIKTHTSTDGKKVAKVYKDGDWNEFRTKHFVDGKHHTEADNHTDDLEDAHGTAQHWINGKYN